MITKKIILLIITIPLLTISCKPLKATSAKFSELSSSDIPEEYSKLSSEELNKKGLEYHKQGNFKKSLIFFQYAGGKDPNNHMTFFNQACALNRLGLRDEAEMGLIKAISLNRKWVTFHLGDPDLKGLFQTGPINKSGFKSKLIGLLYGEYAPIIGMPLTCKASSPNDEQMIDTRIRKLTYDGKVSGKDFDPYFEGSTMTVNEYLGGTWEIDGRELIIRDTYRLKWTSIAIMQKEIGKRSVTVNNYKSLNDLKKLFSKENCNISSTF